MIIKLTLEEAEFLEKHSTKIYDEKNTWYHIPFWFKKIDVNVFEIVVDPLRDNKTKNVYKFTVNHGEGKQERYSKTEPELIKSEKDLLLGELVHKWESSTKENQIRFLQTINKLY